MGKKGISHWQEGLSGLVVVFVVDIIFLVLC